MVPSIIKTEILAKIVLNKISSILISNKDLGDQYFHKWGIRPIDFCSKISSPLFHGGIGSKIKSIKNILHFQTDSVLNIGPETGFEAFYLSEIYPNVIICDPDEDNLLLLKTIADNYRLENGSFASSKMIFFPYGLNNTDTSFQELRNYQTVKTYQSSGMPTFYNVTSVQEINQLSNNIDLIFIHKILSTITRFSQKSSVDIFIECITQLSSKLSPQGVISWTEPQKIWKQNHIDFNILCNSFQIKIYNYKLPKINEIYTQVTMLRLEYG